VALTTLLTGTPEVRFGKLDGSTTTLQLAKMQEVRMRSKEDQRWTAVQHLYIARGLCHTAREDREASDSTVEHAPHDLPLHLPSSLSERMPGSQITRVPSLTARGTSIRGAGGCPPTPTPSTHMYKCKDKNVIGQPPTPDRKT